MTKGPIENVKTLTFDIFGTVLDLAGSLIPPLDNLLKECGNTENLKGSEVLDFRDRAFNVYFKNPDYLSMINKTYGEKTVNHIKKMTNHKINRKHHNTEVNY